MSGKPIAVMVTLWVFALSITAYAQQEVSPPPDAAVQGVSGPATEVAQTKEDERVPIQKQDQWLFFAAPYLWIPGVSINTTFLGHTSSASVGWHKIMPRLFSDAMGVMGRFEAWKGRWGIYVDSYFTYMSGGASDSAGRTINLGQRLILNIPVSVILNGNLKFISRAVSVDFGPRCLVGTLPLSSRKPLPLLSFEVLGGGRYIFNNQYLKLNLSSTLTGSLGNVSITRGGSFVSKFERSFLEPFLGGRLGFWINPKMVALLRFTVGGFGFASDNNLDMDMELDLGYKVHRNIFAYVGWRARYDQFSRDNLSANGWFNGPILGAVFAF
jgi:hypothetical protein